MDENTAIGMKEIPRMNIQWDWKEALRCVYKSKFTDDKCHLAHTSWVIFLQFMFTFLFALRNPRGKAWISCKQESKCINWKTFITILFHWVSPFLTKILEISPNIYICFLPWTIQKKKERKSIYPRSVGGTQVDWLKYCTYFLFSECDSSQHFLQINPPFMVNLLHTRKVTL